MSEALWILLRVFVGGVIGFLLGVVVVAVGADFRDGVVRYYAFVRFALAALWHSWKFRGGRHDVWCPTCDTVFPRKRTGWLAQHVNVCRGRQGGRRVEGLPNWTQAQMRDTAYLLGPKWEVRPLTGEEIDKWRAAQEEIDRNLAIDRETDP